MKTVRESGIEGHLGEMPIAGTSESNSQSSAETAPRRILMLVQHPEIQGPLPKHTPLLIQGLREAGLEVATAPWGRRSEGESWLMKVVGRFLDLIGVLKRLRRERFDALVIKSAHDWPALIRDLPLAVLARPLVKSTVVQFHGGWSDRLVRPGYWAFKGASALLQRWTNGFLLLSEEECGYWTRFRPNGRYGRVDNPFVANYQPAPFAERRGGRNAEPVVLLVGRLMAEKGVMDLVEAVALLKSRLPCRARIAGTGPLRDAALRRAAALGIADRIELLGYLDGEALANAYRAADVFVLPTYWGEGFATVITEAMSMGLPIITTRIRGMADHLRERENAMFVPARDPAALAEAMMTVLSDRGLRQVMHVANLRKIEEFTPHSVGQRYRDSLGGISGWAS